MGSIRISASRPRRSRKIVSTWRRASNINTTSLRLFLEKRRPRHGGQCYIEKAGQLPCRKVEANLLQDVRISQESDLNQFDAGNSLLYQGVQGAKNSDQHTLFSLEGKHQDQPLQVNSGTAQKKIVVYLLDCISEHIKL